MGTHAQVVKGVYEAFAEGRVDAVFGAFDSEIEWMEAESSPYADGNPYIGPDAIAGGVFQPLMSDFESFEAVPENIIDGGIPSSSRDATPER